MATGVGTRAENAGGTPASDQPTRGKCPDDAKGVGADDTAVASTIDSEVGFAAIDKGITHGDSLVMTGATQVRTYAVYSFHDSRDGQALMEVGYKRRF